MNWKEGWLDRIQQFQLIVTYSTQLILKKRKKKKLKLKLKLLMKNEVNLTRQQNKHHSRPKILFGLSSHQNDFSIRSTNLALNRKQFYSKVSQIEIWNWKLSKSDILQMHFLLIYFCILKTVRKVFSNAMSINFIGWKRQNKIKIIPSNKKCFFFKCCFPFKWN